MSSRSPNTTKGRKMAEHLLPPVIFFLLTSAASFPLLFSLPHKSMPGYNDKYIFLWDLWWVQHSLFTPGQSLFHTDLIFFPEGTSLAFHTLTLANGLIGILLGSPFNLLLAFNLLFLLSFILGGWFTYLLVREMSGSRSAGLLAGIVFAFAHPNWLYVFQGQMNLICRQWIPLFLLLILLLLKNGRRFLGLWIGFVAALIFYTSYQQVIFVALLLVPLLLCGLLPHRTRGLTQIKGILSGILVALVTASVLAAPMLFEMARYADENCISSDMDQTARRSRTLENILFNQATGRRFWNHWREGGLPGMAARALECAVPRKGPLFGYAVTAILAVGLGFALADRRARRQALIWAVAAVFILWLMMGSRPEFFGIRIPSLQPALYGLPGISAIRGLSRYVIPLTLIIAILTGLAWASLAKRILVRRRPWIRTCLTALVLLLPFAEYYRAPFRLINLHQPPAIDHQLATEEAAKDKSLLELPFWASGAYFIIGHPRYETTWFQTEHRLKRIGGHISRAGLEKAEALRRNQALTYLSSPKLLQQPVPEDAAFTELLEKFHLGFVNVDRSCYLTEEELILHRLLVDRLGAEQIAREPRYTTYRIPTAP